MSRSKKEIII